MVLRPRPDLYADPASAARSPTRPFRLNPMDTLTLNAAPRETGKKATKAVRKAGNVPCVLYGHSQEPVHFSVEHLMLRPLVYTTETYRVEVTVDGTEHEALLKDIAFHPVTDAVLHADFIALVAGEAISLSVPIRLIGTPPGVKAGGILSQPLNELSIRSLPKNIPGHVEIDISDMQLGDVLNVEDIGLEEGVEVLDEPERTVVIITAPRAEVVEEDADDAELDADAADGDATDAPAGDDA